MEKELRIRVSDELKEAVENKAKELNLGVSSYVRFVLTKELQNEKN